jgi:tetratricopeptide (TPR) repeat protein
MQDEPDAALEEYRKALELDPTLAMAHWRIGQVHFFAPTPRIEEAIAAFKEAVRLAPQWSEAHYCLGLGLALKQQYEEAIQQHRKAIALSEREDERLLISLGECLYAAGRYAQAVQAYQEGIRVARHQNAEYYMMLGEALRANKQLKQACETWKQVIALRLGEDELVKQARRNLQMYCRPR